MAKVTDAKFKINAEIPIDLTPVEMAMMYAGS